MFHEMRYVYEVFRQQSFSKAAKALFLSQPSLSLMVKKAEERVGCPLFDRSTTPIRLTEAGQAYIRAVMQIMEVQSEFQRYLNDAEACLTGTLSLGGTTLFTSYILPPLITAFSNQYPEVEIRLHETHTDRLQKELQDASLDLVADNGILDENLFERQAYQAEDVVLAVPISFAVNRRLAQYRLNLPTGVDNPPPVPLEAFRDEPFLLLREGNDTRLRAERLCARAGFRPKAKLYLDQQITAYHLSSYGMGVSFISDTLVHHEPRGESLVFYRLDDTLARRQISFFHRRSRHLSPPARAFLNMLPQVQTTTSQHSDLL